MRVWIEILPNVYSPIYDWTFHPLMRVWIEIATAPFKAFTLMLFHPLMRVWIEIWQGKNKDSVSLVSPSYEGVD